MRRITIWITATLAVVALFAAALVFAQSDPKVGKAQEFINLLRRPGCPFTITTADGTALVEGRDFESVRDPDMGVHPYAGSYDVWHPPPVIRTRVGAAPPCWLR